MSARAPSADGRLALRDGQALRIREWGAGEPIVLLHGFTGSAEAWGHAIPEALAARGHVLAVDLLGHGESDGPTDAARYAAAELAADLRDVLCARAEGRPALLIGYSMGARCALAAAALEPQCVRGLVLEGGSPGLEDEAERRARVRADAALAERLGRGELERFVDDWMALPLFATQRALPAATLAAERKRRLACDPRALAACLRGFGTGTQPSLWQSLPRLQLPVLLLAGEHDPKFRTIARAMLRALPHSRFESVRGAGHTTHLEQPDHYLGAVLPFVEDTLRQPHPHAEERDPS